MDAFCSQTVWLLSQVSALHLSGRSLWKSCPTCAVVCWDGLFKFHTSHVRFLVSRFLKSDVFLQQTDERAPLQLNSSSGAELSRLSHLELGLQVVPLLGHLVRCDLPRQTHGLHDPSEEEREASASASSGGLSPLYLQAGLAVFLLPVNRDSLAARSSISRLVFSSVTATRSKSADKQTDRQPPP